MQEEQNIGQLLDEYSKNLKFKNKAKVRSKIIQNRILDQISNGNLKISSINQHILPQKHKQQVHELFHQIKPFLSDYENNHLYNFYMQSEQFSNKKIILPNQNKKRKNQLDEQENKKKKKSYMEKMKIWNNQKYQIELKKQKQLEKKEKQEKISQQIKILEQKKIEELQKLQKQKKIEEGLHIIQQRKKKRQQMIRESAIRKNQSLQTLDKVPKYIKLEQAYLQKQRKKLQDAENEAKIKRQQLLKQQQQIKAHEKAYIQSIKLKYGGKQKSQSPPSTQRKVKSDFIKYINKDQTQLLKSKEKINRVKQFQQKIRNIPLLIDTEKRKEIQIKIDKHKNARKYTILEGKALNDDQIYNQFKNFDIDIDPKFIGKKYLQQLKMIPKKQRIAKSNSVSTMPPPGNEKPTYRNYLQDLKLKKRSVPQPFMTEQQKIFSVLQKSKKNGNYIQKKQQVEKKITQKIAEYQRVVQQKVKEMKNMTRYDDSIRKQGQIDQAYRKMLESKLVSLKID